MNKDFSAFEEKIKYQFKDKSLLLEALTHSSYANEMRNGLKCNERMEFLGDAVLSIVTAELLYGKFPDMPEGELSKLRSSLVCTAELSQFAKDISLGDYLLLGKGEQNTGGNERPSILENAFEALIAAIYLDGGMKFAKAHILRFLNSALENHQINFKDYKTQLQEIIQQNPDETLNYVIVGESGPDHDKRFDVEVHLNSNVIGRGTGKSKKQAEQEAAKEALLLMGI
ncbi:MAG: ribonuclease III [Eubacterium sp.]|nr:ribonuclease III [Eubacterium sp.]